MARATSNGVCHFKTSSGAPPRVACNFQWRADCVAFAFQVAYATSGGVGNFKWRVTSNGVCPFKWRATSSGVGDEHVSPISGLTVVLRKQETSKSVYRKSKIPEQIVMSTFLHGTLVGHFGKRFFAGHSCGILENFSCTLLQKHF